MRQANTNLSNTAFHKIYKTLYNRFGPQHWWPGETPFEIIIGAILTQNTNWRNASRAITNIKAAGLLDARKLLQKRRRIPGLIKTAGFYRIKTNYLNAFLEFYLTNYNGNIEKMMQKETRTIRHELLAVRGIGHETADAILLYALGKRTFVADSYARRIFSRHGMVKPDISYEDLQHEIERNLPKKIRIYNEFHALIVKVGKEYCRKNEPLCHNCPLGKLLPRA